MLLPPTFQATLDASTAFIRVINVTASRAGESLRLEPSTGRVTQDSRRSMRWDGDLTIPLDDPALFPTGPADLLTNFGTIITVEMGVQLVDGSVATVPYGQYVVSQTAGAVTRTQRTVTLRLTDLGQRVASYRFENPYTIPAGTDLADAVRMVIMDRIAQDPQLAPTGVTLVAGRVFGLDTETDPWRELYELCAGFGYHLFYDASGVLQLTQPAPGPARMLTVATSVDASFDSQPPNVVVARGEPDDDTPPVQAVVMDTDPMSPTYAGVSPGSSPYGRVTRFFSSPLLTTTAQAELAATTVLEGARTGASWSIIRPYDPTVDPGDQVMLTDPAVTLTVAAVTVDLSGTTTLVPFQ